ncbi:MAG: transporter [Flavobacteriales bacterium]|nr:transporter [Flavobacteriales bacterium]
MKQFILGLGLLTMSSLSVQACDQCGCASSGFMGIVPQFGKHYVGLRYSFQQFKTTHLGSLYDTAEQERSVENFHSVELLGRYVPHKRVQLLASLPFTYRIQKSNISGSFVGYGIGDATIGAVYTVLSTPDTVGKKVRHNILVGAGLKIPTGATQLKQDNEVLHQNLQPGSGSWDPNFNLRYILRIKRWGVSSLINYKLNTTNRFDYKFGDRITGIVGAFYWTIYRNVTFMPQVALNADYAMTDIDNRRRQVKTGGYLLTARAEVQIGYKRFMSSLGYGLPIGYELGAGEVTPKHQFNFSILFLI